MGSEKRIAQGDDVTRATLNPFAGWLHCEECGTDADAPCMGLDNKPAVEVCEGRGFCVVDARRTVRRDGPSASRSAKYKRRTGEVGEPTYAPCRHCGEPHMLFGRAVALGYGWCQAPACRAAYRSHARKLGRTTSPCVVCGSPARYKTCGRPECRNERER